MSGTPQIIKHHVVHNGKVIGLSEREKQVLALIGDGHTTKGIAGMLNISHKTVFFHRGSLIRKLKTDSVAIFTKIAIRAGITALALALVMGRLLATDILLTWDTPDPKFQSSSVWVVYTTNLALPTNQWKAYGPVFSPTNVSAGRQGVWLTNFSYGDYFFAATWTNTFWHTNSPFFSAAASTPPIQTNLLNNLDVSGSR